MCVYVCHVRTYVGLKLMGFKPMSRFKKHFYTKPANFIYPDESVSHRYMYITYITYLCVRSMHNKFCKQITNLQTHETMHIVIIYVHVQLGFVVLFCFVLFWVSSGDKWKLQTVHGTP